LVVVSLPEQEQRATERAWRFLLDLGSGSTPVRGNVTALRAEARDISRHFPLGGRLDDALERRQRASDS
jgi:hypothetical protein